MINAVLWQHVSFFSVRSVCRAGHGTQNININICMSNKLCFSW
jgi:hypothetical protein